MPSSPIILLFGSVVVQISADSRELNFFRSPPKAVFVRQPGGQAKKKSFQGDDNLNRATCTHFHDKRCHSIAWFSLIENRLVIKRAREEFPHRKLRELGWRGGSRTTRPDLPRRMRSSTNLMTSHHLVRIFARNCCTLLRVAQALSAQSINRARSSRCGNFASLLGQRYRTIERKSGRVGKVFLQSCRRPHHSDLELINEAETVLLINEASAAASIMKPKPKQLTRSTTVWAELAHVAAFFLPARAQQSIFIQGSDIMTATTCDVQLVCGFSKLTRSRSPSAQPK